MDRVNSGSGSGTDFPVLSLLFLLIGGLFGVGLTGGLADGGVGLGGVGIRGAEKGDGLIGRLIGSS